ncbi:MAG: hypothetical protein BGN88_00095 [Clostridiales bacterium 43-6]|nr:MAG: hypothetical protein BGN88_00095 [Clostridiales bacterium 43-6]
MNNKELLLASINLQKTERPAVMLLSGGVWANNRLGLSLLDSFDIHPQTATEHIIKTNELVKSDLVWAAAGCNNLALRGIGAKTTFGKIGAAASVDEPLIRAAEDVLKLNVNNMEDDPGIQSSLETTRILKDKIGSDTLIGISSWGPLTLAGLLLGTEEFMIMSIRQKDAVNEILKFTRQIVIKYWSLFIEAGAELVSQAEPSASCDMISPKQFEKMALPHPSRFH